MNEETKDRPHQTRHEQSQDKSAKSEGGGSAASAHAENHDRIGLLLAIAAFGFALLSVGMEVNRALSAGTTQRLQEQVIDAKIQAGIESAKAAMQQQVSDAKATANAGREHARIALDEVERIRESLAVKGIVIPKH
jgi:hypothetical protein